jgi:hypothetical protein
MSLQRLAESRLNEAIQAGLLDDLRLAGTPLAYDPADDLAGDDRLGFRVLKNGGMLPEWLTLAREIETAERELAALDARHREWVAAASASGDWGRYQPILDRLRDSYEQHARALRRKQDRFNLDAPSIALERPAIWVEYHLQRLDQRVQAARDASP